MKKVHLDARKRKGAFRAPGSAVVVLYMVSTLRPSSMRLDDTYSFSGILFAVRTHPPPRYTHPHSEDSKAISLPSCGRAPTAESKKQLGKNKQYQHRFCPVYLIQNDVGRQRPETEKMLVLIQHLYNQK